MLTALSSLQTIKAVILTAFIVSSDYKVISLFSGNWYVFNIIQIVEIFWNLYEWIADINICICNV